MTDLIGQQIYFNGRKALITDFENNIITIQYSTICKKDSINIEKIDVTDKKKLKALKFFDVKLQYLIDNEYFDIFNKDIDLTKIDKYFEFATRLAKKIDVGKTLKKEILCLSNDYFENEGNIYNLLLKIKEKYKKSFNEQEIDSFIDALNFLIEKLKMKKYYIDDEVIKFYINILEFNKFNIMKVSCEDENITNFRNEISKEYELVHKELYLIKSSSNLISTKNQLKSIRTIIELCIDTFPKADEEQLINYINKDLSQIEKKVFTFYPKNNPNERVFKDKHNGYPSSKFWVKNDLDN